MADAKISALTALTGANVDTAADELAIVDTDVTTTKRIVVDELRIALGIATQAQQETGTSNVVFVTPGRQHFHDSAAKAWAYVTVSGGTPTIADSYNITSITDTAVGRLTVTIATDFSSVNWAHSLETEEAFTSGTGGDIYVHTIASKAAGSIILEHWLVDFLSQSLNTLALNDPDAWNFIAFGDHA